MDKEEKTRAAILLFIAIAMVIATSVYVYKKSSDCFSKHCYNGNMPEYVRGNCWCIEEPK